MGEEYFRLSTVTGKSYDVFRTVKILNIQQVCYYLSKNVELRDIRQSLDKNGKAVLVFYFYKDDTKEAYDEWCKNKEEK